MSLRQACLHPCHLQMWAQAPRRRERRNATPSRCGGAHPRSCLGDSRRSDGRRPQRCSSPPLPPCVDPVGRNRIGPGPGRQCPSRPRRHPGPMRRVGGEQIQVMIQSREAADALRTHVSAPARVVLGDSCAPARLE